MSGAFARPAHVEVRQATPRHDDPAVSNRGKLPTVDLEGEHEVAPRPERSAGAAFGGP